MPATKKAAAKRVASAPATDPTFVPIDSGVEVWRNCTPGTTYFTKLGEYGKRETELVRGNATFSLTPGERRINQAGYATVEQDLFRNGTFQPVTLLDDEPDTPRLRDNPNTLTDRDIQQLFKTRGEAFADRVNAITSEVVLGRVLEMAREPRHNVTLAQYEVLKLRQMELKGDLIEDGAPMPEDPNTGSLPKPVTPR